MLAIADAAFEKAGRLAVSAPERGFFGRALALLRWDQGRSEEAIALLQQAGKRFAEAEDAQEQALCSALLGLLYVEEMRTALATPCLRQAAEDLSAAAGPGWPPRSSSAWPFVGPSTGSGTSPVGPQAGLGILWRGEG